MKMPTEKIDTAMFAPCGMNCLVCYKHCYHKKPCAGCLNSDIGKPEHCRKCKIKDCIKGKGLSYCFECTDYPCKLIKNLEKSYNKRYQTSLMTNSEFVASTVWKGSWNSRKRNILVQNVGVSFLSMTESVASVKKA